MTRHVSLFAGVGGFDLGLERAGWTSVGQVEVDRNCLSVLARHWPDVPRWGDVRDVSADELPDADLVSFGSPCQDLSIANTTRHGFDGRRSGLFLEAVRLLKGYVDAGRAPAFAVWENVPGALSSSGGRDFAAALDALADVGSLVIDWRVLDAQHFGSAQRRRRLFVVAGFDRRLDPDRPLLLAEGRTRDGHPGALDASRPRTASRTGQRAEADGQRVFVKARRAATVVDYETWVADGPAPTLNVFDATAGHATVLVVTPTGVRRLTPREWERLNGWPDDWTRYGHDGRTIRDGVRYRMVGNGVVGPVAEWIGRRLLEALP